MLHVVVVSVRLRFGIFNKRFLIIGNFGDDVAFVAGFPDYVAESGDVVGAAVRLLEFIGAGGGNSVKAEKPTRVGLLCLRRIFLSTRLTLGTFVGR